MYSEDDAVAATASLLRDDPTGLLNIYKVVGPRFCLEDWIRDSVMRGFNDAQWAMGARGESAIYPTVLDVGSGTGQMAYTIARLCPDADVWGMNLFGKQNRVPCAPGLPNFVLGDANTCGAWEKVPMNVTDIVFSYSVGHLDLSTVFGHINKYCPQWRSIMVWDCALTYPDAKFPIFGDYRFYSPREILVDAQFALGKVRHFLNWPTVKFTKSLKVATSKEDRASIKRGLAPYFLTIRRVFPEPVGDVTAKEVTCYATQG